MRSDAISRRMRSALIAAMALRCAAALNKALPLERFSVAPMMDYRPPLPPPLPVAVEGERVVHGDGHREHFN